MMKKGITIILSMVLMVFVTLTARADYTDDIIDDTARCIYENIQNPTVSSVGGEWAVIGLARSGVDIPNEYYNKYYENVKAYINEKDGVLSDKKYTEYSRLILALTAIGKNPTEICGYDITEPLGDFEKTIFQGINGAAYALIALDSGDYQLPESEEVSIKATKQMYVDYIVGKQNAEGGWTFADGEASDIDITAMMLQALAQYRDDDDVKIACEKGIDFLSSVQNENAGYTSWGSENSESSAQVIVALCELGISPFDERFVKNGKTLVDNLQGFYIKGQGFKHIVTDEKTNQMSTEQAFYALVALKRFENGKNTLYRMSDVIAADENNILQKKNPDVSISKILSDFVSFSDIIGHKNEAAIEMLAKRGIINGKQEGIFDPDGTMTRAEFATIIVRGLSLPIKENDRFTDVLKDEWFYNYVGTAYLYGIVNGISDSEFNPQGTITKEEAAVMVARAGKLCGMETELSEQEIRDTLAGFTDYTKSADWSKGSLAFLYKNSILDNEDVEIQPKTAVARCEVAQMLANMLVKSNLISE